MTIQEAVDILKSYDMWINWCLITDFPWIESISKAIEIVSEALDLSKVSRLEVISYDKGREYVKWNKQGVLNLEESLQDDGRTLKIFINP